MNLEELKEKYPKVARKHPRIDFELLDEIIVFVKEHPRNSLVISINDISKEVKRNNSLIRKYCLDYAVKFDKLNIHKRGNSHQYPVAISPSGKFNSVKNFDSELQESCSLIIDFFSQYPKKLPKDLEKYLRLLKESIADGKPNIGAQEKLIVILWEEGIKINCLTFRRTNYLFC